jgi:acetolactate decarboxylase
MVILGLTEISFCSLQGAASPQRKLTQISTIGALYSGLYDGLAPVSDMARFGDLGIGTFDRLDGELIQVDGQVYQVSFDGKVHRPSATMATPFFVTTFFTPDDSFTPPSGTDLKELETLIDARIPSQNLFYAVRIDGQFQHLKTRSMPRQSKPYRPFAELEAGQAVFELADLQGVAVGFRCPDYSAAFNAPGYHFHFLNDEKTAGGHVLALVTRKVTVRLETIPVIEVHLPQGNSDWSSAVLPH